MSSNVIYIILILMLSDNCIMLAAQNRYLSHKVFSFSLFLTKHIGEISDVYLNITVLLSCIE